MGKNGQETIGERINRLRLERGLSQRELSSPGVSYAYISRLEAGSRQPSVRALRKLASKLGVSAEYLESGRNATVTDDLVSELRGMVNGRPVTISVGEAGVRIAWPNPGSEEEDAGRALEGQESLTEALMAAILFERELASLAVQEQEAATRRERLLEGAGVR